MELDRIKNCTWCKKDFSDIRVAVKLDVKIDRKKSSDIWELIPNSSLTTYEVMCKDCFDKFAENIDKVMKNV